MFDFKTSVPRVKELIQDAHQIAVDHGWWPMEGRSWISQTNNFYSEVAEAWEEWRKYGNECLSLPYQPIGDEPISAIAKNKPEGFWVEIADLLIRLADSAGKYNFEYEDQQDFYEFESGAKSAELFISELFSWCPAASITLPHEEKTTGYRIAFVFSRIVRECFMFAEKHKIDLWAVIDEKMAYNRNRSFRHGNKHS